MKIAIASDIHLEFENDPMFLHNEENAEVLIIAGDLAEFRNYPIIKDYFDKASSDYERVFIIPGNHEFYHGHINRIEEKFHEFFDEYTNIFALNYHDVLYKGMKFVGRTFWTNFNGGNFFCIDAAKRMMNDFRLIEADHGTYNKFTPYLAMQHHFADVDYIGEEVENSEHPVVVVTHHAPCLHSLAAEYLNSRNEHLNYSYASDYSEFILNNPKIKLWVHGHVHNDFDYMVGNTRIVANPRGYDELYYRPKVVEV